MRLWRVALLGAGAVAFAAPAQAHLVTTGLGPVYDGITHLAVSPADVMAVIAVAMLGGLGGPRRGRAVLAALPLAWLVGGATGLFARDEVLLPMGSAVVLFTLGLLVATDARLSRVIAVVLTAAAGLFLGALNGTALAASGTGFLGLLGIVSAAAVLSCLLCAAAVAAEAPWQRIVVRVAGSWIAAVAILMAGWSFAGAA